MGAERSNASLGLDLPSAFCREAAGHPRKAGIMRILIILNAGGNPQGGVVPEYDGLIEAYYLFRDAGVDVVLAAVGGGSASVSTRTASGRDDTAAARALQRFNSDRQARDVMNDRVDLASVCA
jgi:hypothetical protein